MKKIHQGFKFLILSSLILISGLIFGFVLNFTTLENKNISGTLTTASNDEVYSDTVSTLTSQYPIEDNAIVFFHKEKDLTQSSNGDYLVDKQTFANLTNTDINKVATIGNTNQMRSCAVGTYNLEELAAQNDYNVTEGEFNVILTRKFGTRRLIIESENSNFDKQGAVSIANIDEELYVLQYNTIEETSAAYEYYLTCKNIKYVESDSLCWVEDEPVSNAAVAPSLTPLGLGDSFSYKTWGAKAMGVPEYSQYLNALVESNAEIKELPEVVVAVLDTGIDTDHSWFVNRFLRDSKNKIIGKDYTNVNDDTEYAFEDDVGHGTHCAGIICDMTLPNVKILPVKFMAKHSDGAYGSTLDAISGIKYINGLKEKYNIVAINMSFSNEDSLALERNVIKKAYNLNILPIVAAGNDAHDASNNTPASISEAITVSAIMQNLAFDSSYSNYGKVVDVCAPGSDILSAEHYYGNVTYKSGTSMAAPHIAAYIALLKSDPVHKYSKTDIENILYGKYKGIETVLDLGDTGKDIYYGYGLPILTNLMHDYLALEIVSDSHGSVSLSGENYLFYEKGDTVKLTFTPENNCHVNGLYLDGKLLPYTRYIKEYEIVNLYGKHELRVEFATMYTVNHYLEPIYDLNDINTLPDFSEYDLVKSEVYYSEFDVDTNAIPRDYKGFTVLDYDQKTITTNDTVVNIYYRRNIYNVTIQLPEEGLKNIQGEGKYLYGEKVTLKPIYDEKYNTVTWEVNECNDLDFVTNINLESQNQTFKMPASDITITAYAYYKEFDWSNIANIATWSGVFFVGVVLILCITRSRRIR